LIAAACLVFLTACPKQQTELGGSGPGGDDDRPVTILDGSLLLTWDDATAGPPISGPYPHSAGADVNLVKLFLNSGASSSPPDLTFTRSNKKPLHITVDYGNAAELQIDTNPSGRNLTFKSESPGNNGGLHNYIRAGKFLLKHPDASKKITRITFGEGVAAGTALDGVVCAAGPPVTCALTSAHAPKLEIAVCKGTNCPTAAP
jgi:hypothetical protein